MGPKKHRTLSCVEFALCRVRPVEFALRNRLKTPRFALSIRGPTCGARLVAAPHQQHQQQLQQHQHCPNDSSALNVPAQHKPAPSPAIASLSRSTMRLSPRESWTGQRLTPFFGIDRVTRLSATTAVRGSTRCEACCRGLTPTNGGSQSTARPRAGFFFWSWPATTEVS